MKHSQVNNRVRSGGLYWKQCRMQSQGTYLIPFDIWYLLLESKAVPSNQRWLITNTNLAKLLFINAKTLARYSSQCGECFYHDDAPVHFVVADGKPIKRTRQLLWTLASVKTLLDHAKININTKVKTCVRDWVNELEAAYLAEGLIAKKEETPAPTVKSKPVFNAPIKEKIEDISDSVYHVKNIVDHVTNIVYHVTNVVDHLTNIFDHVDAERKRRIELQEEVNKLKLQIEASNEKPKVKLLNAQTFEESIVAHYKKYEEGINNEEDIAYESNSFKPCFPTAALSTSETLNGYLSRVSQKNNKVDHLTRMGLLNSDQVYSLFSNFWVDPNTCKLVKKSEFQEILRKVFHLKNSTHRTPILKAEMMRNNMAVVRQVTCKKKPNPVDAKGNKLDLDNPAYTSNGKQCIRFQVRYLSKGIDYLKDNWYKLLNGAAQSATV